jgi:hypothetical protein
MVQNVFVRILLGATVYLNKKSNCFDQIYGCTQSRLYQTKGIEFWKMKFVKRSGRKGAFGGGVHIFENYSKLVVNYKLF